jgi:type I restriction enzyme R subunit
MYAIDTSARHKTETAGKIALGIKEGMLKDEQMAAYKTVKYLMFHYWSNPKAYQLTKEPLLVDKDEVPSEYLIRMEKSAVKYLLLDYNPQQSADLGNVNIMKTQRRGEIRYLPFVTTLESIVDE